METEISKELFQLVDGYEISCEIERQDGCYEKIKLDQFLEESVDLYENEWAFRIEDRETIKKLSKFC